MSKVGIVIISFNRPEYFEKCLASIKQANIPANTTFILVDDCSTDIKTIELFNNFNVEGHAIIKYRNKVNYRIPYNIKLGFDKAFESGCDIVMNFDSDAVIKKDAIEKLVEYKKRFKDQIVTGFNCVTKNRDGSERHVIIESGKDYNTKKSVGGINMCVDKKIYTKYFLPALDGIGNWDHKACIQSEQDGKSIVCITPSVVQHIGVNSSMGHASVEEPDTAYDFYDIYLPQITLIGVDCVDVNQLIRAQEQCTANIQFGAVKLLTSINSPHRHIVRINPITNKEQYSRFCIKELNKYVSTDFALVFQYDGYILNPNAWKNEFLQYDYIGATWLYKDGSNVGNGGFSLRSKKLLNILATDPFITEVHPEDSCICRKYRGYLEEKYQIKFANEAIANQFAIEAYGASVIPGANKYTGQFGFHGYNVDFSTSNLVHKPIKPNNRR